MWWKRGLLIAGSVLIMGVVWAATSPAVQNYQPSNQPTGVEIQQNTEAKEAQETVSVPFEHQTINDASLTKGTTQIRQVGVSGEKVITYLVQLKDGVEASRTIKEEKITKEPVAEIKAIGTKVPVYIPTGDGYINSKGNYVPSPAYSDTIPAGASAQCGDGTYSFSQSRRGTCSHHGGVSRWL